MSAQHRYRHTAWVPSQIRSAWPPERVVFASVNKTSQQAVRCAYV